MAFIKPNGNPCIVYNNNSRKKLVQSPSKFGSSSEIVEALLFVSAVFSGPSSRRADVMVLRYDNAPGKLQLVNERSATVPTHTEENEKRFQHVRPKAPN